MPIFVYHNYRHHAQLKKWFHLLFSCRGKLDYILFLGVEEVVSYS